MTIQELAKKELKDLGWTFRKISKWHIIEPKCNHNNCIAITDGFCCQNCGKDF